MPVTHVGMRNLLLCNARWRQDSVVGTATRWTVWEGRSNRFFLFLFLFLCIYYFILFYFLNEERPTNALMIVY